MKRNQAGRRAQTYQVIAPEPKSLGPSIGYLKPVTYDELVARFGEPLVIPPPEEADGRVQVLWRVRWDDGSLNEIYDYKVGPYWLGPVDGIPYQRVEEWNVSGDRQGYRRLVRLFGVKPLRVLNRSDERPHIAPEILQAMRPHLRTLKRNLLR